MDEVNAVGQILQEVGDLAASSGQLLVDPAREGALLDGHPVALLLARAAHVLAGEPCLLHLLFVLLQTNLSLLARWSVVTLHEIRLLKMKLQCRSAEDLWWW